MSKPTLHQVDATFFAQVEPIYSRYVRKDRNDPSTIEGARVLAITQKKPAKPVPGSVTVKLTLRLPKSVFVALQPEAVIEIPESLLHGTPIEVEATDPNEES